MDFELSDDQLALRDAARELLDKQAPIERVRRQADSGDPFDRELWRAMVDQGWLDLEALGLGSFEATVLLEQVGRHLAPVPYLHTTLAAAALRRAGEDDLAAGLTTGARIGTVGWRDDPVVHADVADVVVRASPDGVWLHDGHHAAEPSMDRTRTLSWVHAEGRPIGGSDDAAALLDRAAIAHAAEMLGGAERVLELTTDYAKDRVQFGKPIGSFQAVKHRCADMLVDVEGMRSAVYWAAWCLGADHADTSIAASTAKVWCAEAAKRVMASGLQVHGGVGFTWEHPLHRYYKRALWIQAFGGFASAHRTVVAAALLD